MKLSHTDAQLLLNEFDHTLYMVCDIATKRGLVEKLWHLSPFQQDLIQSASTGVNMQLPYEVLHHAFEDQAQKQAHARAIEFEDKWLSYGELNAQANSLANKLSTFCVKVGDRVAVVMERCLEFPIGLLAVLKVGAAMMPIDAKFPVERIMYMLDDAKASVLITTEKFRCDFQDISIQKVYVSSHDLARDPITFAPTSSQVVTRDNEAYVVYTSGSTGKPKGVPVLHGGIVNVLSFRSANVGIAAGARVLQFMAIGFDGCQWEIWNTLSHGATLVLRSGEDLHVMKSVEIVLITPTGLSMLGHPTNYPNLKCVCVGGEALPLPLKELWCGYVRLFNCYGPTECSILTHMEELALNAPITLGKPIENVNCYVLDDRQKCVPVGAIGELYLGGMCIYTRSIQWWAHVSYW
ncbi:Aste57867_5303 [Aphanomyces stellatus]|uniref:Aste57867_5303 protein n=1 Tax=Aphanomyces stellatus TaxID=120398 RepID=A0A485KED1_9STRA|nr:hypothetical protein As57867_005290 [Aphanomyces stellatus]VFT82369.1 Aste57867_5303 [Aphanomyces stellatus]